jgi:hypothetical protein
VPGGPLMDSPDDPARVLNAPIAVRAYPKPLARRTKSGSAKPRLERPPKYALIIDTETTTDATQRLTFGSYRVYDLPKDRLVREGLIYADDLPAADLDVLRAYVESHADDRGGQIRLLSNREFVHEVMWQIGYRARGTIVGFNLPFDLSRLAVGWVPGRRDARNGFSLRMFDWLDSHGNLRQHHWRPNIGIKSVGGRRQLITFRSPGQRAEREIDPPYRGSFLDLQTLTRALTDRSASLAGAAKLFELSEGKLQVEGHGQVTEDYITYNRQDVRVTYDLYKELTAEWSKHPIDLRPEQAFSAAAVGKAYLRKMRITPILERHPEFPTEALGFASVAYFGGRAETRIRRWPMPVQYVDFSSMYPTVFSLLGLWSWLIADHLGVEGATGRARALLDSITREELHEPRTWRELAGVFCRVKPAGELLPTRAPYATDPSSTAGATWSIGLNPLSLERELWFTLADLVAAKLLGGKAPMILDAFKVVAGPPADQFQPVALRGQVRVDPLSDDLFRVAVEQRKRRLPGTTDQEWKRLDLFLKTVANATAYGVYAEFRQLEPSGGGGTRVAVEGLRHFECRVQTPEEPREYCFPPLAATVTGAGRLLLALLQADVEALGGTYVACDTDSLLIVATETGGLLPCPNGPHKTEDGEPAVRAISWGEVKDVIAGFASLNPYDPAVIPSLLKLEGENSSATDPKKAEQLYAVAISAKRYVLYNVVAGAIVIRKPSEHGLGLYQAPFPKPPDWNAAWPKWVDDVWRRYIHELLGLPVGPDPEWFDRPAMGQLAISTPAMMAPFARINERRPYSEQMKPFGFMLMGHLDPLAPLPDGVVRDRLAVIGPYSSNASEFLQLPWRNRYDGREIAVTTQPGGEPGKVRLKTYRGVINDHRFHPEAKSGDPRGGPCLRTTRGLLPRRHVVATEVRHIGKESNRLEEEQEGGLRAGDAYVEYRDERGEWEAAVPALRALRRAMGSAAFAEAAGMPDRTIRHALNSGAIPHRAARKRLGNLLTTHFTG